MNLELIRTFGRDRAGGLRQLASDIGVSEQTLHRCIKTNKIQASDLELIATALQVDIAIFFDVSKELNARQEAKTRAELESLRRQLSQAQDLLSRILGQ